MAIKKKKPAKKKPTKKAPAKKRNPTKKTTKRKPTKKAPAKKKPAKKPAKKRNPSHELVKFEIGGRPPKPETVRAAAKTIDTVLRTCDPIRCGNRVLYPWLIRAAHKLDIGETTLLHAVCYLAEKNKLSLVVDEDAIPYMAAVDARALPRLGATDEPLVWLRIK